MDGDTVEIKEGALFVNGERQFEEYTFEVRQFAAPVSMMRVVAVRALSIGFPRASKPVHFSFVKLLLLSPTEYMFPVY